MALKLLSLAAQASQRNAPLFAKLQTILSDRFIGPEQWKRIGVSIDPLQVPDLPNGYVTLPQLKSFFEKNNVVNTTEISKAVWENLIQIGIIDEAGKINSDLGLGYRLSEEESALVQNGPYSILELNETDLEKMKYPRVRLHLQFQRIERMVRAFILRNRNILNVIQSMESSHLEPMLILDPGLSITELSQYYKSIRTHRNNWKKPLFSNGNGTMSWMVMSSSKNWPCIFRNGNRYSGCFKQAAVNLLWYNLERSQDYHPLNTRQGIIALAASHTFSLSSWHRMLDENIVCASDLDYQMCMSSCTSSGEMPLTPSIYLYPWPGTDGYEGIGPVSAQFFGMPQLRTSQRERKSEIPQFIRFVESLSGLDNLGDIQRAVGYLMDYFDVTDAGNAKTVSERIGNMKHVLSKPDNQSLIAGIQQLLSQLGDSPLSIEQLHHEPADGRRSIIDLIRSHDSFQKRLFGIIELSKLPVEPSIQAASGVAITLLNMAGISFSGRNFKRIKIPYANLRHAVFYRSNLEQADLSMTRCIGANFSLSNRKDTLFYGAIMGNRLDIPCRGDFRFSSDGNGVLDLGHNTPPRLWDVRTGKEVDFPIKEPVQRLTISPGDELAASENNDFSIQLWDLKTGQKQSSSLVGHTQLIHSMAVSPDFSILVSASDDKTVRIWELNTGHCHVVSVKEPVFQLELALDGKRLITRSQTIITCFDLMTRTRLTPEISCENLGLFNEIHFNSDKTLMVVSLNKQDFSPSESHNTIHIYSTQDSSKKCSLTYKQAIVMARLSPDGRAVAALTSDGTVILTDVETEMETGTIPIGIEPNIHSFIFSRDGRSLVTIGDRYDIRKWNLESKTCDHLFKAPLSPVSQSTPTQVFNFTESPNGYYYAAYLPQQGGISLWDIDPQLPLNSF